MNPMFLTNFFNYFHDPVNFRTMDDDESPFEGDNNIRNLFMTSSDRQQLGYVFYLDKNYIGWL